MKKELIKKALVKWFQDNNTDINITKATDLTFEDEMKIKNHAYVLYGNYYIWGRIIHYDSFNRYYYLAAFIVDIIDAIDTVTWIYNKKSLLKYIDRAYNHDINELETYINDYVESCKEDEEFDYQAYEKRSLEYLEENYDYGYSNDAEDYFEYMEYTYNLGEDINEIKKIIEGAK